MAWPKLPYSDIAQHGMSTKFVNDKVAAQEPKWRRIEKAQEAEEERRMIELAGTLASEEHLQAVLAGIEDPVMRSAVEARLRPHTKFPVPTLE